MSAPENGPLLSRLHTIVCWLIGGVSVGLLAALGWFWGYAFGPGPAAVAKNVFIPPHTAMVDIARQLQAVGAIADRRRFVLLAVLMGKAGSLQAGEYSLPAHIAPYQIVRLLARGRVRTRNVVIPEGTTVAGIGALLGAQQLAAPADFAALTGDSVFIRELIGRRDSLEGYLFPDSYTFQRGIPLAAILRSMVARGDAVWQELKTETAYNGELTRHQILTLASIVEKETGLAEERPLVAGVFLERLRRGMRLQADPTVRYGLGKFALPLRRSDLRAPTPYNTYVIDGLPPGPIANPGRAAIRSVLAAKNQGYLYFVSRNNGSHQFSRTLKEHNRAVQRYQRARK